MAQTAGAALQNVEETGGVSYRWIILVVGMLAYTTSFFARTSYIGITKFIAADLHLDKSALGLMGSVFFYAYALTQMPWGIGSDRWGSRKAVSAGVFATALTLWGFSTSHSAAALNFWRILNGVAAAGAYVCMSGAISQWFRPKERGFTYGLFAAVGGGVGEGTAQIVLPLLVAMSFTWRTSTSILAAVIAGVGILCVAFLKSAPQHTAAAQRKAFDWSIIADPKLWGFTAIYSGSIISIRVLVPWLTVYATDIYISKGMATREAALAGGILSSLYLAGRAVGVPIAGFVSDRLISRGISRKAIAVGFLFFTVVLLRLMPLGIQSTSMLGFVAFLLGASINMYPLITTAMSETFGPQRTASAMGVLNMVAQLSGAVALTASGFLGVALSTGGNALDEYRGIWLVGIVGCIGAAAIGLAVSRSRSSQRA
jgi:sugar phosphate permease